MGLTMGPTGLLIGILFLYGAMDFSGCVKGNSVLVPREEDSSFKDDSANDRSAPFVVSNGVDNNSKDVFARNNDAPFVIANAEDNNAKNPLPKEAIFGNGFTMRIPILNDEPEDRETKEVDLSKTYVIESQTDFLERNPTVLPDGRSLIEGDMLLTKEQLEHFYSHAEDRKAINEDFYSIPGFLNWNARWPANANGDVIIKYLITNSSAADEAIIEKALQHWMNQTCLQFQQITTGGAFSHLFFSKIDSGCFSNVGRIPGSTGGPVGQKVSIGPGCETFGTIVHEVGHAIGFFHEQSRADRDNYVNVFLENVLSGKEDNFNKELKSSSHGVPYDFTSIMHYGDKLFTKNGKVTLSPKDPTLVALLGQREGLSFRDAKLANIIYNCTQKWEKMCNITVNPCMNEGYIGKTCLCVCRPGTTGKNCEQVTGSYYPALPCGGTVTTTNPISSPFFPGIHNASINCVWVIRAPVCQVPKITITAFRAYFRSSSGICDTGGLEIRTNSLFNGTTYCGKGTAYDPMNQDLTTGQTFTATGRELVLNFFSRFINADTGFSATVQFVDANNCTSTTTMAPNTTMAPTTTMPPTTAPATTMPPTTTPATTMPPTTTPATTMPPTTTPATTMPPTTKPPTTIPPTTKPPTTMPPTTTPPDPCKLPLNVTVTGSCALQHHGTKWIWSRSWSYSMFTCTLSVRTQGCPRKVKILFCYFPFRRWSSFCLNHTPLLPWKPLHSYCSSNPICHLARGKQVWAPTSNFDMRVTTRWRSPRPFVIKVIEMPSNCHKRIVLSTTSPTAMISSADSKGDKNCEWFIQAPAGRKIKVAFKSWTFSRACSQSVTNTGWFGWYWRNKPMRICQRQIIRCQRRKGGLLISPTGDVFYKNIRPLCSQTTPSTITSTSNQMTISYQRLSRHRRRRWRRWGWRRLRKGGRSGRRHGWRRLRKGGWSGRRHGWRKLRKGGWSGRRHGWRRWRRRGWRRGRWRKGGWRRKGWRRKGWRRGGWRRGGWRRGGRHRGGWGKGGWHRRRWHWRRHCRRWHYARTFPRAFEATIMLV